MLFFCFVDEIWEISSRPALGVTEPSRTISVMLVDLSVHALNWKMKCCLHNLSLSFLLRYLELFFLLATHI